MDSNDLKEVLCAAIGAFVTITTAYIAARWHITKKISSKGKSNHNDSKPVDQE